MSKKPNTRKKGRHRKREEAQDVYLHAAATIVAALALGFEFEDCRVDDDGLVWPTPASRIYLRFPRSKSPISEARAYEAGQLAVAKRHGRGPCLIVVNGAPPGDNWTRRFLDIPRVWEAIESLALHIMGNGGARGGDESIALSLIALKLAEDAEAKAVLQ
jgi:hypothetical protein